MNDYYEVRIDLTPTSEDATDLLAAMLGDIGYESFVPDSTGLTAYVKAEDFSEPDLHAVMEDFPFDCEHRVDFKLVPGQDWNVEWEKNYFKPIVVDDQCVIHSSFHTDIPSLPYDIVIDPKMAFGTGHHATTWLIVNQLLKMDLQGSSVIDMGTGTGILAILCAMKGASLVYGIEIDPFAYENAVDNARINHHEEITMINGDASALRALPRVDLFIANINRNIITEDLSAYVGCLKPGATVLLSGFYEHDIPVVMATASPLGLTEVSHAVKGDGWTCLTLSYHPIS